MKKRVLITGSSGMLGTDLIEELDKDFDIYGMDLTQNSKLPAPNYRISDITDRAGIAHIIDEVRPETVIHTAAWTDVDGCELDKGRALRINRDGTEDVASACRRADAVMVYISTDFVFDGKKKAPYKEQDKPEPLGVYGYSKLMGEEAVKNILKKHLILRTSWLYGRNGKNFVDTIISKSNSEKALKVVDDQVGSPTYTVDLAKAIHALLDKFFAKSPKPKAQSYGIYHVSNAGAVSWHEYAKEILKLTGSKTEVLPISSKELNRPAKRPAMSVLDNSKFRKFTGFEMRAWKEALRDYLQTTKTGE